MKWLNKAPIGGKDYSVRSNIEKDHANKILSEDAYKVLDGVHQRRDLSLVMDPSDEDILFLKKCYGTYVMVV